MSREKKLPNCLIKNVTESLIKKGSLTHNMCYRSNSPKRRAKDESTVQKRIHRGHELGSGL